MAEKLSGHEAQRAQLYEALEEAKRLAAAAEERVRLPVTRFPDP